MFKIEFDNTGPEFAGKLRDRETSWVLTHAANRAQRISGVFAIENSLGDEIGTMAVDENPSGDGKSKKGNQSGQD